MNFAINKLTSNVSASGDLLNEECIIFQLYLCNENHDGFISMNFLSVVTYSGSLTKSQLLDAVFWSVTFNIKPINPVSAKPTA